MENEKQQEMKDRQLIDEVFSKSKLYIPYSISDDLGKHLLILIKKVRQEGKLEGIELGKEWIKECFELNKTTFLNRENSFEKWIDNFFENKIKDLSKND